MQDEEIRIACINAVMAWTGESNKIEAASKIYDWVVENRARREAAPVKKGSKQQ